MTTPQKLKKKMASQVVVVVKTQHYGKDILFKEKLAEANEILSKTTFKDGSKPVPIKKKNV